MANLDKKDCVILNILQENCRASLTEIAKQVGLSVDSTRKRIKKMQKNGVFHPKVQIRPRRIGFSNIVDVKIKLNTHAKTDIDNFIKYLIVHPRVSEIFTVNGDWDMSIVVVSKDIDDLDKVTSEIKNKFGNIIGSWSASTTLKVHKFEYYNLHSLLGLKDSD